MIVGKGGAAGGRLLLRTSVLLPVAREQAQAAITVLEEGAGESRAQNPRANRTPVDPG